MAGNGARPEAMECQFWSKEGARAPCRRGSGLLIEGADAVGEVDEVGHGELLGALREKGVGEEGTVVGPVEAVTPVEVGEQGLDTSAHHLAALVEGGLDHAALESHDERGQLNGGARQADHGSAQLGGRDEQTAF